MLSFQVHLGTMSMLCLQLAASTEQLTFLLIADAKNSADTLMFVVCVINVCCVCLKAMNYEDHPSTKPNDVYQDRAAERRRTVGSDSPRDQNTTTSQPASVHRYSSSV